MSIKRQVLKNLNWNWAGTLGDTVVAFLLCPYLLTKLGATHYGAWVMIGSLTGYFGLLDFGIRGSVGRYVAFYRAKNDGQATSEIVMTAFALLATAGVIGALATSVVAIWAGPIMGSEFGPDDLPALRWALVLAGINLGLQLPLNVSEGVLWGCQRFDQLNSVRMPLDLARGILSAVVVFFDGGLVALSVVALALTVIGGIAKTGLAWRAEPALTFRLGRVDRGRMKEVFSFGIWSTIRSVTTMIPTRVTPLVVGGLLGVSLVAPLSIAARLIATASAILVAATGVITPIATALHAREDHERQQDLLVEGGKYSLAAATLMLALFLLLGKPLIHLWVGPEMALAYPLLALMAIGRWVSMSQVVTRGVITAQAKHRWLALSSMVQAIVTLGLGLALLKPLGVIGVVLALAVGDAICEGLFSLTFGCKLLGISPWRYVARITGPTLIALTIPVTTLTAATWLRPVATWLDLIVYGTSFSVVSVAAVVGWNERPAVGRLLGKLVRRLQGRGNEGLVGVSN